jgi:16S rRNA G527 N7-methylase RsmG
MVEAKYPHLQHHYPSFILKYPKQISWYFFLNKWIHVRTWYVLAWLKKELSQLKENDIYTDIGCGEGLYSLALRKKFTKVNFVLIDKLPQNIEFAQLYIQANKLNNITAHCQTVEEYTKPNANLSLCVGVFQYIQEQEKAMQNIFINTTQYGKLLIYFSINGRFVLKIYQRMLDKYPNYESIQNRQRVYSYKEAMALLSNNGFIVEKQKFTYSFFGILANEIYNIQIINITKATNWQKPFLYALLYLSFYPILLLNIIDYSLPKKNGNGLLVLVKKEKGTN